MRLSGRSGIGIFSLLLGIVAILLIGAGAYWAYGALAGPVTINTPYQAVLLTNGQVFYGKLSGYGTRRPILREVYYIKSSVDPTTHEPVSTLVKRGMEWHAPDRMYLNPNQIILVEPVSRDSRVAQLIVELRNR